MANSWFSIRAAAADAATVDIFGEIGAFGVNAASFAAELKKLGPVAKITVRVNSLGGDVFDSIAIYNLLKSHPARITVRVEGIAASGASIVAMAGTVVMPANTFLMIHEGTGFVLGGGDEMRDMADIMDSIDKAVVGIYAQKTGLPDAEIAQLMADETWLDAADAKAKGFADEVTDAMKIAARADLSRFKKPPSALARTGAPAPAPDRDAVDIEAAPPGVVAELCDKADVAYLARHLIDAHLPMDAVRRRLDDAKAIAVRVNAAHRINAALDAAALAKSFIVAGATPEHAGKTLAKMLHDAQSPAIINAHAAGHGAADDGGRRSWDKAIKRVNAGLPPSATSSTGAAEK